MTLCHTERVSHEWPWQYLFIISSCRLCQCLFMMVLTARALSQHTKPWAPSREKEAGDWEAVNLGLLIHRFLLVFAHPTRCWGSLCPLHSSVQCVPRISPNSAFSINIPHAYIQRDILRLLVLYPKVKFGSIITATSWSVASWSLGEVYLNLYLILPGSSGTL